MNTRVIIIAFMLSFGTLAGFGFIYHLRQVLKKVTKWSRSRGEVIGFEGRIGRRTAAYYPKVEFHCPGGEVVVFVASVGLWRQPSPGRKVRVCYSPRDPQDADILSIALWLDPFLMAIYVVGSLAAALAISKL